MYRSEKKALDLFTNDLRRTDVEKLYGVVRDVITLPGFIQLQFSQGARTSQPSVDRPKNAPQSRKRRCRRFRWGVCNYSFCLGNVSLALVDGIKYQRICDEEYYAQELFEQEELTGYLNNMLSSEKSVYEHVVYDSATVEKTFAEQLEKNEAIKVYAKLPGWFKVPTPLGTYNPDWAVLVEKDGADRLYFVVETKSSLLTEDLRDNESAKIQCGKAHFKALAVGEHPAEFIQARNIGDLMAQS